MKNDWGLIYNITYRVANSKKRENEREAFAVKLCPKCNAVYEMTYSQYKGQNSTHYHEDFPRRGLNKQLCFKCK